MIVSKQPKAKPDTKLKAKNVEKASFLLGSNKRASIFTVSSISPLNTITVRSISIKVLSVNTGSCNNKKYCTITMGTREKSPTKVATSPYHTLNPDTARRKIVRKTTSGKKLKPIITYTDIPIPYSEINFCCKRHNHRI